MKPIYRGSRTPFYMPRSPREPPSTQPAGETSQRWRRASPGKIFRRFAGAALVALAKISYIPRGKFHISHDTCMLKSCLNHLVDGSLCLWVSRIYFGSTPYPVTVTTKITVPIASMYLWTPKPMKNEDLWWRLWVPMVEYIYPELPYFTIENNQM